MNVSALPTLNAVLNASAALAMILGFIAIRRRRIAVHRACMLSAVGLSILFLCSYLVYHAQVGSRPYAGGGWLRGYAWSSARPAAGNCSGPLPMTR